MHQRPARKATGVGSSRMWRLRAAAAGAARARGRSVASELKISNKSALLQGARDRLYRNRSLLVKANFSDFFEMYKFCAPSQRSKFKNSANFRQLVWHFKFFLSNFAQFAFVFAIVRSNRFSPMLMKNFRLSRRLLKNVEISRTPAKFVDIIFQNSSERSR